MRDPCARADLPALLRRLAVNIAVIMWDAQRVGGTTPTFADLGLPQASSLVEWAGRAGGASLKQLAREGGLEV